MTIKIVDKKEAELVDWVVCSKVGYFDDDLHGVCVKCGCGIVFRPHAPKGPPKICLDCMLSLPLNVAGVQ